MHSPTFSWRRPLTQGGRPWGVYAASLLLCGAAWSQTAPPASPAVALTGNGKLGQGVAQNGVPPTVAACATCHGARGEGSAAFPPLAGNGAAYLLAQLQAFADGSRAQPIMGPIAKALKPQQRADVVAFYAALPHVQRTVTVPPPEPSDAGAWLAQRGRWADGIPACAQCHGPAGLGVGEHFPAIAGLSAAYMQTQVSAWKNKARPPGPLQLMSSVAQKLTDQDLTAVAAYYAHLQEQPASGAVSLRAPSQAPEPAPARAPAAASKTSAPRGAQPQGKP